MKKEIEVKDTSLDYDDCLEIEEHEYRPNNLSEFLGLSNTPETEDEANKIKETQEWKEKWIGMPDFESKNNAPAKQLTISFKTLEDYEAFGVFIGQQLTTKTKSIWYPKKERAEVSLLRWIDADADE